MSEAMTLLDMVKGMRRDHTLTYEKRVGLNGPKESFNVCRLGKARHWWAQRVLREKGWADMNEMEGKGTAEEATEALEQFLKGR